MIYHFKERLLLKKKKVFNVQVQSSDGIYVVPVGAPDMDRARELVIHKEGVHPSRVLYDSAQ